MKIKKGSRVIMLDTPRGTTREVLTVIRVYYMGHGDARHRRITAIGDLTAGQYDAIDTAFAPARDFPCKENP